MKLTALRSTCTDRCPSVVNTFLQHCSTSSTQGPINWLSKQSTTASSFSSMVILSMLHLGGAGGTFKGHLRLHKPPENFQPVILTCIMEAMARGWESKSVEEQQAEAAAQKQPAKSRITPQQAIQLRTVEGLRLSRQRVLQQLANVRDQRLRQMFEQALSDLDRRIKALKSSTQ
jgi:hypothetical protein